MLGPERIDSVNALREGKRARRKRNLFEIMQLELGSGSFCFKKLVDLWILFDVALCLYFDFKRLFVIYSKSLRLTKDPRMTLNS